MWNDEWFCEQPVDGKLLFHYLFTNPHGSVAGIYLLPIKFMAFDTGIPPERVRRLLTDFQNEGKIEWSEPVIWVKKMRELQIGQNGANTKLLTRIERDLWTIPDGPIKQHYLSHYTYPIQGSHEPRIPYPELASETETEPETETETKTEPEPLEALPASPADDATTIETQKLEPEPKAKTKAEPKPFIAGTPTGDKLAAQLKTHYEATGRDPPKKYRSPEMQVAFDKAITALGSEFEAMSNKAFARGIESLDKLLSWYEGCAERARKVTNHAGNQRHVKQNATSGPQPVDPTRPKIKPFGT